MIASRTHQKASVGKHVGRFIYIHRSAKETLFGEEKAAVERAKQYILGAFNWSVIKIEERNRQQVSFLDYEDFEVSTFPALNKSCTVDLNKGLSKVRNYSQETLQSFTAKSSY